MGASSSKRKRHIEDPSTQERHDDNEVNNEDERLCSNRDSDDDGSFVFIDKEWSCSVSSAEDAVLLAGSAPNETFARPEYINSAEKHGQKDTDQPGTSCADKTGESSQKKHTKDKQGLDTVENESVFRKESDSIVITQNPCSVAEEFPINLKSNTDVLLKSSSKVQRNTNVINNNCTPPDVTFTGKEEWIKINGRLIGNLPGYNSKLFDLYEIFSNYGSISALAKTNDHIYIKFSSWAGVENVLDDVRNLKQLHQIDSLGKVKDDELKSYPNRKEIYLDLPSFVVAYLKDHNELSKALNVVTMAVNDNIFFNAPKIQQILDHIRKSLSKEFQHCTLFPFGCHVLGSCDRFVPLEIFVDIGDMYKGCHKQSDEEQITISKQIRKLISDKVVWYSQEESPIGVLFHKTVGLHCILYFNNGFGDRCTRLLRVFMDYDERFRVLYLILDIWSKQCCLQGVSNGLNSYIVALLLIFYLQVLPVPLLPPLQQIRASTPVFIKGWDCTFIEDVSLLPRTERATELNTLLRGFFVFYGSYDWNRVVCPVLGQSIDRNIFSCPSAPFPDDPIFANYLRAISEKVPNTAQFDISTSMCVQDFFNLSENIAKGVSPDTLFRFQALCHQAHKMIYSAESRISFGPHMLPRLPKMSSVPYHVSNCRRREQSTNNFNQRARCGPISDCTTSTQSWERSTNSDLPNEYDHGKYCAFEGCSYDTHGGANGRRKNSQDRLQRPPFQNKTNNSNYEENTRNYRSNRICNSRGREVQENNCYSRSYRGRIFWHNTPTNSKSKIY